MLLKLPRRPRQTLTDSLFSLLLYFLFVFGKGRDQRLPTSRLANTKHPCFWLSLLALLLLFILHFDVLISGAGQCCVPELYILAFLPSYKQTFMRSFCSCCCVESLLFVGLLKSRKWLSVVCNAGISVCLLDGDIFKKRRKHSENTQKSTVNQCCIYFFHLSLK